MTGVLDWLLDSDPALRWQVERDLAGAPPSRWRATRARVAHEGWGARLLALQDPDGRWAGGAYFPVPAPDVPGQAWTATTWSLTTLREWGLDPAVLHARRTAELLDATCRWEYEDLPYWDGEVDCCINASTLANGVWLGRDVSGLARWFADHRLDDGGWNCEWVEGARRSSFHSTLNSLIGLLAHETATGGTPETREARRTGEEYLLTRELLYRRSTGERVGPWVDRFAYPFRWRFDVLRATDHFRRAHALDGGVPDPRLAGAVDVVRAARGADGRWRNGERDPGAVWFEVDVPAGEPSRWLTLYATRVLTWWDDLS
ncbi:squalene cyclase [Pseudonocardia sp. HH130630-07]|uniref:squalene cyclase n=1 Tax=Pseudonocardia sp. HH130630-07 TaxID=1690815 RepID=UPI0008153CB0|nr:squalene cyclase [Pseudonocardia sp. HH130630-07]ANY07565.1 squalene cyclase [Pseudonocardia sp. HH130630-07]